MHPRLTSDGDAFGDTVVGVPSCALDARGLELQRERHRRVARAVAQMRRSPRALTIDFQPNLDRRALQELIAVERECCPFFAFSFDERLRRLQVTVHHAIEVPALDAIAAAFSVGPAQA